MTAHEVPRRWALIPLKALARGKSRLAGVLERNRRAALIEGMLHNVVTAALGARHIDRVLVVSPEHPNVPTSALTIRDHARGLIPALDMARRAAIIGGAERLLVLPADLPLVTAADIDGFIERASDVEVAVALDKAASGTNGLWLPALAAFRFRFGIDSARRHQLEAGVRGLSFARFSIPALDLDIDSSEDLRDLANRVRAPGVSSNVGLIGMAI